MTMDDERILSISALQHWSYCPRQCGLIHLEQQFDDNIHTMRGHAAHERVDDPGFETCRGMRIERALPLYSDRLGLVGKADAVEFAGDGSAYPVEYKYGRRRPKSHDELQVAAQAMCLEEMTGKRVPHGALFYVSSRRRRDVPISAELCAAVEQAVREIRAMLAFGRLPPAINDARCRECSLKDICQPEAMGATRRLHDLRAELCSPQD